MPRYYLQYATFDNDKYQQSNIAWHAGILFLKSNDDDSQIVTVQKAAGLYSHKLPEGVIGGFWGWIRKLFGISYRLSGSYGEVKLEAVEEITAVKGLRGHVFEVSKGEYDAAMDKVKENMRRQEEVLKNAISKLEDSQIKNLWKKYYSRTGKQYSLEKIKNNPEAYPAITEQGYKKLSPEEKQGMHRFDFNPFMRKPSYTCKNYALDVLEGSLNPSAEREKIIQHIRGRWRYVPKHRSGKSQGFFVSSRDWQRAPHPVPYAKKKEDHEKRNAINSVGGFFYYDQQMTQQHTLNLSHAEHEERQELISDVKRILKIYEMISKQLSEIEVSHLNEMKDVLSSFNTNDNIKAFMQDFDYNLLPKQKLEELMKEKNKHRDLDHILKDIEMVQKRYQQPNGVSYSHSLSLD